MALNALEPGLPPQLSDAPSGRNFPWGRASLPLRPMSCTPCTPCTPHSAPRGRVVSCVQDAGPRWPVMPGLGPGSHPARALLGGCCSGGWHGGGGVSSRVSLPASSRKILSGGAPTLGAEACPQSRQARGAAGRSRRAKLDQETAVVRTKLTTKGVCPGFFANLFRNLVLRSIRFEFALALAETHRT